MRKIIFQRLGLACVCLLTAASTGCITTEKHALNSPAQNSGMGLPSDPKAEAAMARAERDSLPTDQGAKLHLDIGKALEGREEFDSAIAEYQQAIQALDGPGRHPGGVKVNNDLRPSPSGGWRARLIISAVSNRPRSTIGSPSRTPRDPKIWNDYGFSKALQGQWSDSEKALRTAVKLDPANARYQTNLGMTLASEGKTDEALKTLTRAAVRSARHNIGIALVKQGKLAAAHEQLSAALALAPDHAPSRAVSTKSTSRSRAPRPRRNFRSLSTPIPPSFAPPRRSDPLKPLVMYFLYFPFLEFLNLKSLNLDSPFLEFLNLESLKSIFFRCELPALSVNLFPST